MSLNHRKSIKVVGAGRLFFQPMDPAGNITSSTEAYLGDSPGFTLSVENENLEDWSSDGPIATKDVDVAVRVNRTFSLQTKDISFANIARFIIGTASTIEQSVTPVVGEEYNAVAPGGYIQLGATPANPVGVRNVTAVTVTDDDGTPVTFELGEDYELDADTGRILILESGLISNGTNLRIDYTPGAASFEQVSSDDLGAKYGRLRYVEDATFGPARDLVAGFVQLKPTGELAMKSREAVQQMGWECTALTPPAGGASIVYAGRPVA